MSRGAAYLGGQLFRHAGWPAFFPDAATGKKLWEARIADPKKAIRAGGAIAWNGMVFIGNAGGDRYQGRGRMYGLDAKTGKVLWETIWTE